MRNRPGYFYSIAKATMAEHTNQIYPFPAPCVTIALLRRGRDGLALPFDLCVKRTGGGASVARDLPNNPNIMCTVCAGNNACVLAASACKQ